MRPLLGRTNRIWSQHNFPRAILGTFPTFQVPIYQILSHDFPILGIKCLYFPSKTVIFSKFSSHKKSTSGKQLSRSGEDVEDTCAL